VDNTTLEPEVVLDVFLNPGDFYFGTHFSRMRTLLGSCVSIILWHPEKRLGGMCHFLLPSQGNRRNPNQLDGRYADEACILFERHAMNHHTHIREFRAKIFGGADMFGRDKSHVRKEEEILLDHDPKQVGVKNIKMAHEIVQRWGIPIVSEDTGGLLHRRVYLTNWNGEVWVEQKEDIH
jgi:chemotaxis protein CheD